MGIKAPLSGSMVEFANPPASMEVIKYTYFSRKLVGAQAVNWPSETQFFTDQVGVAGATARDTNLQKPNTLASNPNKFLGQFINCTMYNTVSSVTSVTPVTATPGLLTDINQVIMQTYLRMELMSKEYLTVPTYHVPAGGGLWAPGLLAQVGTGGVNGEPTHRNAYACEIPFERETTLVFKMINANIAGASTAIITVNALYVEMAITGLLMRPRQ